MSHQQYHIYEFGPFRLDVVERLLVRDGKTIPLQLKAFDLLLVLVQNNGHLLEKDELLRAVWPDTIVEEVNLANNISVLRQALGESGRRYIKTVPRRGYRFLAEVRETQQPNEAVLGKALKEIGGLGNQAMGQLPGSVIASSHPTINLPSHRLIVGREEERAKLHAGFASVSTGRGLMLCVAGEPGIGKTSLIEDFLAELSAGKQRCRIARGRCSERLAGTEAYLPLLEALDSLLREVSDLSLVHTTQIGTESVAAIMRQIAPMWYAQVAPLRRNDSPLVREMAEVTAASQERMKRELAAFAEELSRDCPLVIFFDDLHWADVSTIDLLSFLATKFDRARLLVVVTYRPSDMLLANHPFLWIKPDLQSRGVCHDIPLEFLSRDEIERYLALEFPDHRFPGELSLMIHAKTEGNPLFMVDLTRYLRDQQRIAQERGCWVLAQAVPDIAPDLPESVRGMIERKIAQLSKEDRYLLVVASVQGYEFDSAAISLALGMDPVEVEERLEKLEKTHAFLRLIEETEFPDHTLTVRYRFVHLLYQNALYASLRPSRKAALSAAVAGALLKYYGEQNETVAAELAFLFETARDWSRAADFFLLAALKSFRVFAYGEIAMLSRRGLGLLRMLPDTPRRARQEIHLQLTLGFSLGITQGVAAPETGQCWMQARELCQQTGETARLFPALFGLWAYYQVGAEMRLAHQTAGQLLQLAEQSELPILLLGAHMAMGIASYYLGELETSHQHFERGFSYYDPQQTLAYRSLYWLNPGVLCRSESSRTLWLLGCPEQGLRRMQEALDLAQSSADPHSQAYAFNLAVFFYHLRRDVQQTYDYAEMCIAHCHEHGIAQEREWVRIVQGWALTEQGLVATGIAQIRQSIAMHRTMRSEVALSHYLALLSEALGKAGQVEEGFAALAEAMEVVERTEDRSYQAELYRLKGILLLHPLRADYGWQSEEQKTSTSEDLNQQSAIRSSGFNPQSGAEACFRQAIEISQRQRAKSFELRAVTSLCRLLQQQGKQAEAREMLANICGWFTEGFDTADLKEANALLEELMGGQRDRPAL